jgi:hypothetical protein
LCSLRVKDVFTIVPGWHYAWQLRFAKIEPDATHRTCEATSGLGKFTCQMIGACVFLWYSSSGSEPVAMTLSGTSGRASPGKQTDSLHGLQSPPPCGSQPRIIFRSFALGPLWALVLWKTHSISKHKYTKRHISIAICLRTPIRTETPLVDGTASTS